MSISTAAVVGGGMAGLAAAARLRRFGVVVTVFERERYVGGAVRTVRRGGWVAEYGPHLIGELPAAVQDVVDAGGGIDWVHPLPAVKRTFVLVGGEAVPIPGSITELIESPLLSLGGRLRMLRERFEARGGTSDESVAAFARRRFGEEVAVRMFDPLARCMTGGDPSALLASRIFPAEVEYERTTGSVLKGRARARMEARRRARREQRRPEGPRAPRDGMGRLPEAVAAGLGDAVVHGIAVTSLGADDSRVTLFLGDGSAAAFDAVILAVPASATSELLARVAGGASAEIGAIPEQPMCAVSLGYRRADIGHALDGYRVLVPGSEHRPSVAVTFPSALFEDRAPAGHMLFTVHLGADAAGAGPQDLIALARADAETVSAIAGEPVFSEVGAWHALPQPVSGHARRLAAAAEVETVHPGVAMCGSWHDGPALADAIRGGVSAAERLAARKGWREPAP